MTAQMTKTCPTCLKSWPASNHDCPDDGSMLVYKLPEDASLVGLEVDGRYRVERLIAEGGMGRVYVARQLSVDRPVALKVLLRSIATNVQAVQRFQNEARAASRLTSAHTVTVYDFGQEPSGLLYIAMEYVEGRSLWRALEADGAFPVDRAVAIACQIIESLSEAHAKGIVHRDIKPDNVLLTSTATGDEIAKVTDFGIAKVITGEGRSDLTTAGMVVGTPRYLSPEQIRGQTPDARSDIYSLGVVLYELLAGVPPFDDKVPMNLLVKHLSEQPILLHKLAPRVPGAISSAVHRALSKDREQRFESARAFRDALIQAMGHVPRVGAPTYHPEHMAVADTGMHAAPPEMSGSRSTTSPYDEEMRLMRGPGVDPAEEPTVVARPAMRLPNAEDATATTPAVHPMNERGATTRSATAPSSLEVGAPTGTLPGAKRRTALIGTLLVVVVAVVALAMWQLVGDPSSAASRPPGPDAPPPAAKLTGSQQAHAQPPPAHLGAGHAGDTTAGAADAGATDTGKGSAADAAGSPPAVADAGATIAAAADAAAAEDAAGGDGSTAGAAVADAAPLDATAVRTVHVLSEPAGATVLVGEEAVGTTPIDVAVPLGASVEVTLQHKGFKDERRTFGDNTGDEQTIPLEKLDKKKGRPPVGNKQPDSSKQPSSTKEPKQPTIDVPYID